MSNRISWVSLVLALVMLLSSGMTVSAQDNDVHLPLISNEAEPRTAGAEAKPHPRRTPTCSDVSIVIVDATVALGRRSTATKPPQAGSYSRQRSSGKPLSGGADAVINAAGVDTGQVVYRCRMR